MKMIKKSLAIFLAALMIMTSCIVSYAADGFTVTADSNDTGKYFFVEKDKTLYLNSDDTAILHCNGGKIVSGIGKDSYVNVALDADTDGDETTNTIRISFADKKKAANTSTISFLYNDNLSCTITLVKCYAQTGFNLKYSCNSVTQTITNGPDWTVIAGADNASAITSESDINITYDRGSDSNANDTYEYKIYKDIDCTQEATEASIIVSNNDSIKGNSAKIRINNPAGGVYYLVCRTRAFGDYPDHITRDVSAKVQINVAKLIPITDITLTQAEIVVNPNSRYSLKDNDIVSVQPDNANTELVYEMVDTSVATVDGTSGYVEGKKVGSTELKIYSKNNPSISKTCKVTVLPTRDLKDATISGVQSEYTFLGDPIKPTPVVQYGGETLKKGTAYELEYVDNENGVHSIVITGKDGTDYAGSSVTVSYKINTKDLSNTDVTVTNTKESYSITDKDLAPEPTLTVKFGTKTLKKGVDYNVVCSNNKVAGVATATVVGIGNYSGAKTISYNVCDSIKKATVSTIPVQAYTGNAIKPTITLVYNGVVLDPSNYTVTYSNNIKIGKATAKITGNAPFFKDTVNAEFQIVDQATAVAVSKMNIGTVTSKKKQITVKWKKVAGVTGYQVQYANDKKFKKSKKTVTVKGAKKTSRTIKKLKSKKTYYVRVRNYKVINGKKVYSKWSKAKSIKVK